jgi:hypothetical protein
MTEIGAQRVALFLLNEANEPDGEALWWGSLRELGAGLARRPTWRERLAGWLLKDSAP